jgi:aminopeptidase N
MKTSMDRPRHRADGGRHPGLCVLLGMLGLLCLNGLFGLSGGLGPLIPAACAADLAQHDAFPPPSPPIRVPAPDEKAPSDPALGRLQEHIRSLASTNMAGRGPGSEALDRVAAEIADAFRAAGLQGGGDGGDYFQAFTPPAGEYPVAPSAGKKWGQIRLQNVIGLLPGNGGPGSLALVVGAHYDHLGVGEDRQVYTGADDNASGVALLLELARRLRDEGPFPNTIVFVAFSGEEEGVLGSRAYAGHPAVPLERTLAMLNLDTVGRMQENKLYIFGESSAAEFPRILKGINLGPQLSLVTPEKPLFASDQIPFFEKGLPVLHFFSGPNQDYHRPSDTEERINYPGMLQILGFVDECAVFLAQQEKKLAFVPPGAASAPPPAAGAGPARRVSLGTIPDFAKETGGVLLSGTMPGSPAEKAGLLKGDILTRIGPAPVDNLSDLSAALKAHAPGDTVEVEVLRGGQTLRVHVQLVERK